MTHVSSHLYKLVFDFHSLVAGNEEKRMRSVLGELINGVPLRKAAKKGSVPYNTARVNFITGLGSLPNSRHKLLSTKKCRYHAKLKKTFALRTLGSNRGYLTADEDDMLADL